MKEHLLVLNLNQECLDSTGSVESMRERLMKKFYPTSDPGAAPLHHAALAGNLQSESSQNPTSDPGATPLHHAAQVGNLQSESSPNPTSDPGATPLHHASIVEGITKEVQDLKVGPLRDKLKSLGLDPKGLKAVLQQRLLDHLLADSSEEIRNETMNLLDFQKQGSVIKQIPKASRIQAGKSFAEVLRRVILFNDLESWGNLFRFARDFFGKPNRGGAKRKSLSTLINERLLGKGQKSVQSKKPAPVKTSNQRKNGPNFKTLTADKLRVCDIRGAIRIISSDDKILPVTEENRKKLEEKHPKPHKDTVMPEGPGDMQGTICEKKDVVQAIQSFKNGSAAGPDGFMPQYLKDMTQEELGASAQLVLDTLVDYFN